MTTQFLAILLLAACSRGSAPDPSTDYEQTVAAISVAEQRASEFEELQDAGLFRVGPGGCDCAAPVVRWALDMCGARVPEAVFAVKKGRRRR